MPFTDEPVPYRRPGIRGVVDGIVTSVTHAKLIGREPQRLENARRIHQGEYQAGGDPLVSVIVATYNRSRILLERTIPSLLSQTYPNLEVLIVGDRCIDDTPERVRAIADPRVRFHDLPRRGCYPKDPSDRWFVQGTAPRNWALRNARGLWFNWISDDDILLPHAIESLLRFAQHGGFEFVSAAYEVVRDGEKRIVDVKGETPRIGGMQTWLYRSYLRLFPWNNQSWRKSWNRPVDYDLQDRMHRAGVRMEFLDEVVAFVPPVEGTNTVGLAAQIALEGSPGTRS